MYKFPVYFTDKEKIDFLQRVILIHSYLYYEKDSALWTDKQYDEISNQLYKLQKRHKVDWIKKKTQYGYVFFDYDGNTGFDLLSKLTQDDLYYIQCIRSYVCHVNSKIVGDSFKKGNR